MTSCSPQSFHLMFLATLESCQLWLVLHVVLPLNTNLVCPCRDLLWPNYFIWPINLLSLCEHPLVLSFIVCLQLELINRFSCSSRSVGRSRVVAPDRHFPKFDTPNWSIFVKNLFHSSSATVLVLLGHHQATATVMRVSLSIKLSSKFGHFQSLRERFFLSPILSLLPFRNTAT